MEQANTRLLAEINEDDVLVVVAMITNPTGDEYARFVAEITAAMRDLPEPLRDATMDRQLELLNKYVGFNTPYRVIQAVFPHETAADGSPSKRRVSFSETNVHEMDAVSFADDGTVHFHGGGTGSRGFADGGVPRYKHLFERYLPVANPTPSKE
jgi:hypothetical protein